MSSEYSNPFEYNEPEAYHYSTSSDDTMSNHSANIKLIVGSHKKRTAYILPRKTLNFYSSLMRHKLCSIPYLKTITIEAHEPAAFDILVAWMSYETKTRCSSHQSGAELDAWIAVEDEANVDLAWKVWALANYMGGAFATLRDECMKFLYRKYMGNKPAPITPGIAMFVLRRADVDDLRYFVLDCLARAGAFTAAGSETTRWSMALQEIPGLRRFMAKGCRNARLLSYGIRGRDLDYYLARAADVTPDGVQQRNKLTVPESELFLGHLCP